MQKTLRERERERDKVKTRELETDLNTIRATSISYAVTR
jgi:hypothetical protein